jgi:hypothetical protein
MSNTHETQSAASLSVGDLFTRYLERQTSAQAEGLGFADQGELVSPYDTTPVQPVDPAVAWKDSLAAAAFLAQGQPAPSVPPEWPALVLKLEPTVSLSFSLGNYPQLVRNLYPLLSAEPAALRVGPSEPVAPEAVVEWAKQQHQDGARLLAAGVLRLARHFEHAEELLAFAPEAAWKAVHANEVAALAWHQGEAEKAVALWEKCGNSPVTRFNRGMAALFLGDAPKAVTELTEAVAGLPESSAWHHLGRLYLALAQTR